mmetsp:Transcript_3490/g.3889  ORF Transcript_3490/g.3889 Transcript_3490/m.3889 type:complete len:143 (-) Transcript_3490:247-675(-)
MSDEINSSNLVNNQTRKEEKEIATTASSQQKNILEQIEKADARAKYKERKRNYSNQRRRELDVTWDILYETVEIVESTINDNNNGSQKQEKTYTGKKRKNITENRKELVERSIKLLKKMHTKNQENDSIIMNLTHDSQSLFS